MGVLSIKKSASRRQTLWHVVATWSRIWLTVIGMKPRIAGSIPPNEHYVIVVNHISYIDTITIFCGIKHYFRPLGKAEVAKIPVFGYLYSLVALLVDRNSSMSRARSMRQMTRFLEKEGSVLLFPEGTFNETGQPLKPFFDGAFHLALSSQTNILPVILPDTHHRWHYGKWWKLWPGINRVLILKPISVEGLTPADLSLLKQTTYNAMEEALKTTTIAR